RAPTHVRRTPMLHRQKMILGILGLMVPAAWAIEPSEQKAAPPQAQKEGVIDPKADAELRRMSDYLNGLKTFRVETTTIDEHFTKDGHKVQELKESKLAVKRPNQLAVDRIGPRGRALFRYDGKQFTIYGASKNQFAIASAPPKMDA